MRAIDADHLRRWILSRVFKTQLSIADVIDQIDREDTIEPDPDTVSRQAVLDAIFSEPLYKTGMKKRDSDIVVPAIYEKIKALPPSPSKPQWIPCSERLPDEEVLCCDTRGEMIIGYPYQDEESSTGYGAVLDDVVMIDCIAWMLLPEPYREEGD